MPRTKGAVDKRPRRRQTVSRPKSHAPATPPSGDNKAGLSTAPSPEFFKEIDAAMGGSHDPQVEPAVQGPTAGTMPTCTAAPVCDEIDPLLTKEAWEGVLRVPFRMLAIAVQAPAVADIGNKRAKELAKPSYLIFEHYAKEYLSLNPDNPLSFAWAATALVLADISADVAVEVAKARADRRSRQLAGTVPGGEVVQQSQAA